MAKAKQQRVNTLAQLLSPSVSPSNPTPTRYIKVTRRLSPKARRALRPFAKSVGELVWAYNLAHSRLAWFFNSMFRETDINIGRVMWLSLKMDHLQRELLIAALEAIIPASPIERRMLKDVLWAANKIDKLAGLRNDAVHMVTRIDTQHPQWEILVESTFTAAKRAARLQAMKDMNKAFRHARTDLLQLTSYVAVRAIALLHLDKPIALQRRPRLLCHVTKS